MSPGSPSDQRNAVERQLAAGRIPQAVRAANALVAAGNDDRETLLLLGRALEAGGRWLRAAQVYRRLVGRDPDDEVAASLLAAVLARSGRAGLASAAAAGLDVATAPDSTAVVAARAAIADVGDDPDEAVTLHRELFDRRPDDAEAAAALAVALARADRRAEAAAVLAAARETRPNDVALARAAVLVAIAGPDPVDLEPWQELLDRWGVDHATLADVVDACARRGRTKLALRLLGDARPDRLDDPLPRALVGLVAERQRRADRTVPRLVEALTAVPTSGWVRVFKLLVKSGKYSLARALVHALEAQRPRDRALDQLRAIAGTLPADADIDAEASGELAAERSLVVVSRPQPEATVLVFTGNVGASQLIHTHLLAGRHVAVAYLRHFKPGLYFLDGIPGEAEGYDRAVDRLRELRDRFGRPLYVIGQSMPGFAAIRYAIDLEAQGVLALNTPTDLSPEFIAGDRRSPRTYARIQAELPGMAVSLAPLLAAAPHPPRVWLYYNADAELDVAQARRLEDVPSVSLHPVAGGSHHNVLFSMLRHGLLEPAVDQLLRAT